MDQWTLPDGWDWVPLHSVAADTGRRNPETAPDESFRYVEISSVDNETGTIKLEKVRSLQGRDAPSRARKIIETHDIIFATTRPYLKNIALVSESLHSQICSTGFCVIRARSHRADPKYIYYACRSDFFVNQLIPKQRGASYPAVTDGDVFESELPIPYPNDPVRSLATQRRIVTRIEALFDELREMRRLHETVEADTERLMEAVLGDMFPNPQNDIPSLWSVETVGNISEKPQYGYTQSAEAAPIGPKFLRISDIQNGEVDWDSVPYCESDASTLEKYRLRSGDIVFARSGATTGKTFLVKDPPEAVFASYLIRLQIHGKASPEYVYWFFQSPYYWRQIQPRGAAQPNVNASILSELKVPIPARERVQDQIVSHLNQMSEEVKAIQAIHRQDKELLEQLEQAILAQAFRGEL